MSVLGGAFGRSYRQQTYASVGEIKRRLVWSKGRIHPGYPPEMWRLDDFGWWMKYSDYGDRSSEFGWELDHYPIPVALGGLDTLLNLRPLHWRNNASRGGVLGAALS